LIAIGRFAGRNGFGFFGFRSGFGFRFRFFRFRPWFFRFRFRSGFGFGTGFFRFRFRSGFGFGTGFFRWVVHRPSLWGRRRSGSVVSAGRPWRFRRHLRCRASGRNDRAVTEAAGAMA
jgi:hypothetical protein